jgi:hypothetical protein
MTTEAPEPAQLSARPEQRPRGLWLLWYALGGSLPPRHATWVLHDTTCPTWWLRHFARTLLVVVPLLVTYLAVMPSSLAIRLLAGLTFAGGALLFSFVNILVDSDRRAVRAGYPAGLAAEIRSARSDERQRLASYQRRERIAERQARRSRGG